MISCTRNWYLVVAGDAHRTAAGWGDTVHTEVGHLFWPWHLLPRSAVMCKLFILQILCLQQERCVVFFSLTTPAWSHLWYKVANPLHGHQGQTKILKFWAQSAVRKANYGSFVFSKSLFSNRALKFSLTAWVSTNSVLIWLLHLNIINGFNL